MIELALLAFVALVSWRALRYELDRHRGIHRQRAS